MYKIMIIEDNEKFAIELQKLLERYSFNSYILKDFENIENEIKEYTPHLIILDVNLPIKNGYYICKDIRKSSFVPIIILTSRDTTSDEVFALSVGADDFINKPITSEVLIARVERILKRCYEDKKEENVLLYKDAVLYKDKGKLVKNKKEIIFTKNEQMLFEILFKNIGNLTKREDIIKYLWDSEEYIDDNTLTVNVTRLKQKLAELEFINVIETRRGQGYILN